MTPTEKSISDLLRRTLDLSHVDCSRSLVALADDRLIAQQIVRRVAQHFHLAPTQLGGLEDLSVAQLALHVESLPARHSDVTSIVPELATHRGESRWHDDDEHPLTPGMMGLWFLYQYSPSTSEYITPHLLRIRSKLSLDALRGTLQLLTDRHSSLRTVYGHRDGVPYFRVLPEHRVELVVHDASTWDDRTLQGLVTEEARRPFDLTLAPPFRAHLVSRGPQDHVFLFVGHHILWDYASFATLLREFNQIYPALAGGTPIGHLDPPADLRDYVRWHHRMLERDGERQWSYWSKRLAAARPFVELPTSRPRPPTLPHPGTSLRFQAGDATASALQTLARRENTTLYAALLVALELVLSRHTAQSSLCITSLMSGRTRPELQSVVGYLVNPVVLRAELSGNPRFVDLLRFAAKETRYAFAHQEFPFAWVVDRLHTTRDESRRPFQQVVFVFQQSDEAEHADLAAVAMGQESSIELGGFAAEVMFHPEPHVQFDLTVAMSRIGSTLGGLLKYSTALFSEDAIRRFADDLVFTLSAIAATPERRIDDVVLPSARKRSDPVPARRLTPNLDLCLIRL